MADLLMNDSKTPARDVPLSWVRDLVPLSIQYGQGADPAGRGWERQFKPDIVKRKSL